jgi:DNA polymerase III subunit epsilon
VVLSRQLFRRRDDPLARRWRDFEYAVVDLETTGLDLEHDEIVSYGAVIIRDGRVVVAEHTYAPVCPTCDVTPKSVTVHTLRRADVADAAPLSDAVAVLAPLLSGRVMVAHASWIEEAFLTRAFTANGMVLSSPIIDTAAMARAVGLASNRSRGEPDLESLAGQLRLPVVSPHHALGDAITTAHVFLALAFKLNDQGYRTARDFIKLTKEDRALRQWRRW